MSNRVLIFSAPWCGPCKMYKPMVEAYSDEHNFTVEYINIDDDEDTAKKYGVRGVPTTIILDKDDNVAATKVGALARNVFDEFVSPYV